MGDGREGEDVRAVHRHRAAPAPLLPPGLRWGPALAAGTAAAIGAFYLLAWLSGAAPRWSASGLITVKTNMALALVLAGAALVLVEPRFTTPARRTAGVVLAAVVFLVGALTLLEHALGIDLGIDQLLATEPPGAAATTSPNRIGPPGSLSLMLLGAGLLATARKARIAPYLGLATAVLVLVPGVGFLYGIAKLYREPVIGIAWPTVVALLALSFGLVLAQGRAGTLGLIWRDDPGGALLRQLLPAAVLVPLVLQYLRLVGERAGLFGRSTGLGLLLVGLVFLLSALLWRSAARLSAAAAHAREAQQQARWRADLLDLAHDAILVWSPTAGIESWNDGAARLYGYTLDEALGRSPRELLGSSGPTAPIDAQLDRVGHWEGEFRHRTRDGRSLVVSSKLRMVRGVDGLDRVLETNRDITGRKGMEDELRESSRRKDEFLGLLSHELRNPLAPIRNSLYILEHAEPTGQRARRAQEVIGRQIAHLAHLVDDLLEVTRISRGKIQLRRRRLDLADLVRRTGDDHRALLQERGLEYVIETPGQPVWVEGDETRLAQVIGNLLQNSAKFTPAGGTVSVAVGASAGAAEIRVRDTGAGFPPALLEHIFEPFVQAEQTLARTEGGLGLGLSLVMGLTELHGGSVTAASEGEGRGAEFVVRLPMLAGMGPVVPAQGSRAGAQRTLRVLVVDDNVDAAETLAEVVRMFGHQVDVAHDGRSAVEKATAGAHDVILCDIGLPGMSGYEVARALRSNPGLGAVRLVAVSGYAQPEDVQRAADAGFVDHLAKPPDPAKLEALLS
jgi:PAS domain S-box-containing protein